jgi:hypothetical protein
MKGSIRVITGLVVSLAAAGGLDNAADSELYVVILVAVAGIAIMYSGVSAMNGGKING